MRDGEAKNAPWRERKMETRDDVHNHDIIFLHSFLPVEMERKKRDTERE